MLKGATLMSPETIEKTPKYLSWAIVAVALSVIVWGLSMYLLQDTRNSVCDLRTSLARINELKLDKTEYYNAHNELMNKVDLILKLHLTNKPADLQEEIAKSLKRTENK